MGPFNTFLLRFFRGSLVSIDLDFEGEMDVGSGDLWGFSLAEREFASPAVSLEVIERAGIVVVLRLGFTALESRSGNVVGARSGSKTSHTNPVIRPLEHSCRKAIISQNWSNVLGVFQPPNNLALSDVDSSNSSTKRAFGSSG